MASKILKNAGIPKKHTPLQTGRPTKTPYEKGRTAYGFNQLLTHNGIRVNPYFEKSIDYAEWNRGYNDAYLLQLPAKLLKYH